MVSSGAQLHPGAVEIKLITPWKSTNIQVQKFSTTSLRVMILPKNGDAGLECMIQTSQYYGGIREEGFPGVGKVGSFASGGD